MEETSFLRTLKQGCELLNEEIEKLKAANKTVLDGATAFKLNDTFGFLGNSLKKSWKKQA